jgi:hypothetical protein
MTSLMKKLVRGNSSLSPEVRRKQVAQYLGDDTNALPDAPYRPTSLTKFQDQPFKSQYKYLPRIIQMPKEVVGKNINELKLPMSLEHNPSVALGGNYGGIGSSNLSNYMGLGSARTSIGKDEQGKPYLSMFDSWDFANPHDPMESILRTLGKPFNIYDRIPITPGPGNTIPEQVDPFSKGDIDLPAERPIRRR